MAAPKNNKNAEKWTEVSVLAKLFQIEEYVLDDLDNYHIGGAIIAAGLYPQWWSEMTAKFKDNKVVSETIKRIEGVLEVRLINDTLNGDVKGQAMAIFYLKNKHGYKDKTEVDATIKQTPPLFPDVSEDESN